MTFDREELLATLADAAPALAKSTQIEGFKNFWFYDDYVYAYDGGLGVRLKLATELECGVPGKILLDLLKTSSLKEVFIDQVKDTIVLQMGKSKVNIATSDIDILLGEKSGLWAFPDNAPKKVTSGLVISEAVIEALNQVSFVRMSKGTQTMHHGVTVIPQKGTIEFYSTDSKSMAQVIIDQKPVPGLERFIMPWGFVDRIQSLVEPGATLHVLEDCLVVDSNEGFICSNLLEVAEQPDLPGVAASYLVDEPASTALPAVLQPVLDRAKILAGGEDALIIFSTKGDLLTLTGKYPAGSLNEPLKLASKQPEMSGKFMADLITRGLPHVEEFMLNKKALVLYGGKTFVYIISMIGK